MRKSFFIKEEKIKVRTRAKRNNRGGLREQKNIVRFKKKQYFKKENLKESRQHNIEECLCDEQMHTKVSGSLNYKHQTQSKISYK